MRLLALPRRGGHSEGATRRAWLVVGLGAASAMVSQAFGRFTYSLLFTDVRDDLGLSNTLAGAVGSANLAAYLTGSLVVGLLVGRLGLVRTLTTGICGSASGLALLAWSPSVPVVLAAAVGTGFFGAFVWITAPGLATAELGPGRRGVAVGIIGAGIGLGIVTASLLASSTDVAGWRRVYLVEAAVGVAVAIGVIGWLRPSRSLAPAVSTGPSAPAPVVTPLVAGDGGGRGPGGGSGSPMGVGASGILRGFGAITDVPGWAGLLSAYALFALAMSTFITFTVAVLVEDAGWDRSRAALAFTSLGVGTVVGGPLFGPLSDRLGRGRVLAIAFAVIIVAGIVVPLGWWPWSPVAALAFGTAFTGVPTTVTARVSDFVAAERFGAAYSTATLAFGAGLLAGPQLGGALADWTGSFRPAFVVVVACACAGAVLAWRQPGQPGQPGQGQGQPAHTGRPGQAARPDQGI